MILSRARDALQTPADTRFQLQWKRQGRGLKNTHKYHFVFLRLPEVVKIKVGGSGQSAFFLVHYP